MDIGSWFRYDVPLLRTIFRLSEQSGPRAIGSAVESLGTVEKAIDVLFHLHERGVPQGVTAIGRALEMPKSSTHRLLTALGRRGLVESDERGRYRPGIALMALALGALDSDPVVMAARPALESAVEELGETVFLVGARGRRLVVLDKAEGTGFLRASPRIGTSVPVHATAVGKLFLALAPESIPMPAGRLESFTPATPANARDLAREIERAHRRGFAENVDEWIPGLSVIAAPVVVKGRMRAAVAVAASTQRLAKLGSERVARRAISAAEHTAARLEGRA